MSVPIGNLFIIPTPLGNLGDISSRAITCLQNADIILAEDTRRASLLLKSLNIPKKQCLSLHEHNESERIKHVLNMLQIGHQIALISDAGTPCIADPGYLLIKAIRESNFGIIPVPGPCAPIVALSASGMPAHPFTFLGFLPRKTNDKKAIFQTFLPIQTTLVFFERKDRIHNTLKIAYEILGNRDFCIARELTKKFEEFIFGSLENNLQNSKELLGEITVIIAPNKDKIRTSEQQMSKLLSHMLSENMSNKDAIKKLQTITEGWTTKEIYLFVLQQNKI